MLSYSIYNEGNLKESNSLSTKIQYHSEVTIALEAVFDCSVIFCEELPKELADNTYYFTQDKSEWKLYRKNTSKHANSNNRNNNNATTTNIEIISIKDIPELEDCLMSESVNQLDRIQKIKAILIQFQFKMRGTRNLGNSVGINYSNVGDFLISDNFGPCQAVVAFLTSGKVAIYHAFSAFTSQFFDSFIDSIRNNVKEIFVFQKNSSLQNTKKAPFLAVLIANELKMDVKRIRVEDYKCVIADAQNQKIILTTKINYVSNATLLNTQQQNPSSHKALSIDEKAAAISLRESVLEILDSWGEGKPTSKGVQYDNFFIANEVLELVTNTQISQPSKALQNK